MQKAIEALEKGALLGDANCQYNLAYFTYHGKLGIKKIWKRLLNWPANLPGKAMQTP